MDGGGAAPEADGHRLRRMPRHAQQGKEFRRFRGYHGPPDDPILFYCQRAHFGEELSGHMSFNIATALKKYRERNSKSLTLLLTECLPACSPSSLGFHVIYRNWYTFRFKEKKCNIVL